MEKIEKFKQFDNNAKRWQRITYEYCPKTNSYIVVDGNGNYVVIPPTYNDGEHGERPVSCIAKGAFDSSDDLISIEIADSVKHIESYAFHNCSKLINVKLPKYLKVIEYIAFARCTSLEIIELPENVKTIWSAAFMGCTKLKSVISHGNIELIYDYAFQLCESLLKFNLDNINNISESAFCNASEDMQNNYKAWLERKKSSTLLINNTQNQLSI